MPDGHRAGNRRSLPTLAGNNQPGPPASDQAETPVQRLPTATLSASNAHRRPPADVIGGPGRWRATSLPDLDVLDASLGEAATVAGEDRATTGAHAFGVAVPPAAGGVDATLPGWHRRIRRVRR